MSASVTLERRLVAWALEEGFDRAGIAPLGPSEHAAALRAWLRRGDQAGMEWIERRLEPRLEPATLLAGARSALCVALQYHPLDGEEDPEGDLWPRVARYARGEDYHLLMERRLRRLGERVTAELGAATRTYVDTGPILERELAARAGLGAIGKNTQLLHPDGGSWFLLGELLTTLEVEADGGAVEDLCGSCTACLEACPTGALPEPYRLDARRCISYWTIEHRGAIPDQMRDRLGGWVFGCDVCQEVCPVNVAPRAGRDEGLKLPEGRAAVDLERLAGLSRDEYVELFRRSPMKRAKLGGLKRNAALAMASRGAKGYVPVLAGLLDDGDETVRSTAAWALGRLGGAAAVDALGRARERETEASGQAEISAALEALGEAPPA